MFNILSKERFVFAIIIVVLMFVIAYGAIWFNGKYALMPIEREKIENVEACLNNDFSCSLIINSQEKLDEISE